MNADRISGIAGGCIGVAAAGGALALGLGTPANPQPGLLPIAASIALAGLSSALAVRSSARSMTATRSTHDWRRAALVVGALLSQAALLEQAGYIIATTLSTLVVLRVLAPITWRSAIVVSALLAVGTYLLFGFLDVALPAGILTFS